MFECRYGDLITHMCALVSASERIWVRLKCSSSIIGLKKFEIENLLAPAFSHTVSF